MEFQKLFTIISLIIEIICLIASIWICSLFHDGISYIMVGIFVVATIVTSITIFKSFHKNDKSETEQEGSED